MTLKQVMAELKSLGTEKNRKTYARVGAGKNMFGVSFGDLGKLAKRIKRNQPLAEELWDTGNTDAQALATLIADHSVMDKKTLESWVKTIDFCWISDYYAVKVVAKSNHAQALANKWMKSRSEYIGRCGYHLMGALMNGDDVYSDEELTAVLETIKAGIHNAPNRKRESMNHAVIAIGSRPSMKQAAINAAKAIGKVEIDHGETSCKTPEAIAYIEKVYARKAKKA